MDELELRRRQLARLKGETVEPIADFPNAVAAVVSDPNWKPEPRMQPENEVEPEPFIVGHRRNKYGDIVALPVPKWPCPGELITPEIEAAHFKEELLMMDANRSLTDCVRWLAGRLRNPEFWNDVEQSFHGTHLSGPPSKLYDTAWSFLLGTWRARGITPPTDDKLREWAMQYNEKHYIRKKANAKTEA